MTCRSSGRDIQPFLAALVVLAAQAAWPAAVVAQGSIGVTTLRPFVVSVIPVVGRGFRGAVGGVSVDVEGVLSRSEPDAIGSLRVARLRAFEQMGDDIAQPSKLRKISLRRLEAVIAERRQAGERATDEMLYLAGIWRLRYVFVYPERNDIVLAGPAEGWKVGVEGEAVGIRSGEPTLRLDDLVVALRSSAASLSGEVISCSIDPEPDGVQRVQKLLRRGHLRASDAAVEALRLALGPQRVTITGVEPGSHFARVMVAADYRMKRLAMGLDPAPVDGLPSYMDLLRKNPRAARGRIMPRWWLAPRYEPMLRDESGLAWELRGPGVEVRAGATAFRRDGSSDPKHQARGPAQWWAEALSERYEAVATELPVFARLRNCMDLAVVAALVASADLGNVAGFGMPLLTDEAAVTMGAFRVPQTVESEASIVRVGRRWVVSISGGVEMDGYSVLGRVERGDGPASARSQAAAAPDGRWWWD